MMYELSAVYREFITRLLYETIMLEKFEIWCPIYVCQTKYIIFKIFDFWQEKL